MSLPERIVSEQSATPVVIFHAGGHCCGISAYSVDCVIPVVAIDPVPGAPRAVLGVVNFHGAVVPVVDPRRRFGDRGGELVLSQKLIVVNASTRQIALLADRIDDIEQIAPECIAVMDDFVPGASKLKGSAARKDGLIFVHDAGLLLTQSEEKRVDAALRRLQR
ncbi:MAG TPA: chemotaxis protein CheW [Methyloceanibacter sp.]|nr:chemotaxis protein CheW [Methyloceanibacter sp.]